MVDHPPVTGVDVIGTSCAGCATEIPTPETGRPRRWCSDACRKRARRETGAAAGTGAGSAGSPVACRGGDRRPAAERPAEPGLPGGDGAPEDEFPDTPSRYYAKFADTAGQRTFSSVRKLRYRLRHLLRQVSTVDRCRECGWSTLGQGVTIKVSTADDGTALAGFGGIETCGRIWLCPVCSAKIRLRRGDEIARGVAAHIAVDGAAYFLTATLPHEHTDELAVTLDTLAKAWRHLTDSRAWKRAREHYGIVGTIKAVEVTHGGNGWHPHAHVILLTARPLEFHETTELWASLDAAWARGLTRQGWPAGRVPYRFRLDAVQLDDSGSALAAYVAKVQDRGLGNEMARADLKTGRASSRTPFEILADFGDTARADDLELWWEFEHATRGRSAIRWSPRLRALLLPDEEEKTDEEIAAEDVGGELVAVLRGSLWARLRHDPDAAADALQAVELLGWEGLVRVLLRHRIGTRGLYTPEEWQTPGAVELDD